MGRCRARWYPGANLYRQEIFIPETGLYEFSGYFAANCQQITLRIEGTESHSISFPGNNIEWEKQTLLFYANEGDVIRLEISSIQSTALTGYIMDDICLTRCEAPPLMSLLI